MRRILLGALLVTVMTGRSFAKPLRAYCDVVLAKATIEDADSVLSLTIKFDSCETNSKRFLVEHDSVLFSWIIHESGYPALELTNRISKPMFIVWDSSSAINTRGFLLEVLGETFDAHLKADPTKIKPGKSFRTGFMSITRRDKFSGYYDPILPGEADFSRDEEVQKALAFKGRYFKYVIAVDRGDRLDRYTFTFVIRDAVVR